MQAPVEASVQIAQTPLPGTAIQKYVHALPHFSGARVTGTQLTVTMEEFQQKVLPDAFYTPLAAPFNQGSYVWGYNVDGRGALYPAYSIVAEQGEPTTVTWVNNLKKPDGSPPVLQKYLTNDQTLHWADPNMLMCMMHVPMPGACMQPYAGPVAAVAHLHGAEVPSAFDGGPDQWFTPDGMQGPGFATLEAGPGNQAVYRYPNEQEAATLWFHDHTLGATRLNVYGGLAGFYLLRDDRDTGLPSNPIGLPADPYEIELAIQDRMFDRNGQLLFPDVGLNVMEHPFWLPEFFGDTIVVNGRTWPYLNVEPRRYRFRIVDGSNARFYQMALYDPAKKAWGPPLWQIGTDGGLLDTPVKLNDPVALARGTVKPELILGPGERADIIIDFTGVPLGTTFVLRNVGKAPFPNGTPADPQTVGQIMQFRVVTPLQGTDTTCNPNPASTNPCNLRGSAPIVRLANPATGALATGVTPSVKRQLTLVEVMGMGGPLEVLLNNTTWAGIKKSTMTSMDPQPIPGSEDVNDLWMSELPLVGSTEVWEIINLTADAHPIHLHLVQFQLLNRQRFQAGKYLAAYDAAFPGGVYLPGEGPPLAYTTVNADGAVGGNPAVGPYLQNRPVPPRPVEAGWKDTVLMYPGEVTRVAVRFAPQRFQVSQVAVGQNLYPFDPTLTDLTEVDGFGYPGGPGYVWHCHIVDHEDNEMMRPYVPVSLPAP